MTTDHDNLLAAVLANPGDDNARLFFADWLEENAGETECGECGGRGSNVVSVYGWPAEDKHCHACSGTGHVSNEFSERSEFIRVQCEIPRLEAETDSEIHNTGMCSPYCTQCPRLNALRQRERELWNDSRLNGAPHPWIGKPKPFRGTANWLSSHNAPVISTTHKGERVTFMFERGFISTVTGKLAVLVGGPPWEGSNGRTPGIAREIAKCQPVTRWIDPTRKPLQRGEHDYEYGWTSDDFGQTSGSWALPERVFDLLGSGKKWFDWKVYDSEADAIAALSDAVATIAKQQGVK